MPQFRVALIFTLVSIFLCYFSGLAQASAVGVTNLGVNNAQGMVAVDFSLVVQDEFAVLEALHDGGEFEVTCTAKLYNRRMGIWNEFLAEDSYICTLSSNPIAREFRVQDQRGTRIFEFSDLADALNGFWSGLSLTMGNWEIIERNKVYKVVLTFKVSRTNVPGWVSKSLFFVEWDLVPELSYEFEFDY